MLLFVHGRVSLFIVRACVLCDAEAKKEKTTLARRSEGGGEGGKIGCPGRPPPGAADSVVRACVCVNAGL